MMAMLEHLAIVAVMAAVLSTGCTNSVDEPQFKITTKRDNDKVEVKVENDKSVFSVHSPFGISQAVIERADENWSDIVKLRLQLKGLENFKVTNGMITLEAAVSSQDSSVRLWKDGKEDSPLAAQSPYWMKIRMFSNEGKLEKTIPLDGYFEIQLPKALFEDNPKSITVNWIDFYR
jgi:biopolymer transport protein ExbD